MRQIGFAVVAAVLLSICVGCSGSLSEQKRGDGMEARISVIALGVSDIERSWRFYKELGLPTEMTPEGEIVIFSTMGTQLWLCPYDKLAEDIGIEVPEGNSKTGFGGITVAHATRSKGEVDELLRLAEKCGGKIVKEAQDVFWGGYSGYFTDPDGYFWEVMYFDGFKFEDDGSISIE